MVVDQVGAIPSDNKYLQIEVVKPTDLLQPARKGLLANINNLLNDVYGKLGHPKRNGELPPNHAYVNLRIETEDQLVHELGEDGLMAICTDDRLPDEPSQDLKNEEKFDGTQPGMYGKVVAVAGLKPWKGNLLKFYLRMQELKESGDNGSLGDLELAKLAKKHALSEKTEGAETWDWEVTTCGSIDSPVYRRQGLIIQCMDSLTKTIKERRDSLKAAGDPVGNLPVKLWSTTLEGSGNTEYWLRRGFVRVGDPDAAPVGLWSSLRSFEIQTLSKDIG